MPTQLAQISQLALTLSTIGHEGATLPEGIATQRAAAVEVVVDVHTVATFRKAGVSNRMRPASLAAEGIGCEDLWALGSQ